MGSRWGPPTSLSSSLSRIVAIITAFTLGHSITLSLAAMGTLHVPARPVEALIAASILISALHALRPLFPGKEAWIAAAFGLVHGLAFATTLERLGLSHWDRVAGILAFNLGIETMQLIVVAVVLPSLVLMSRTRFYGALRICGGAFAIAASAGWLAERIFDIQTPVDRVVNALARHGLLISFGALLVSLAAIYPSRFNLRPASPPAPGT
jgi:HupE / UreJ protein